jgi:hypothetical protein
MVAVVVAFGAGATTLWASGGPRYTDWSEPVNLGPLINTPSQEQGPALSKDGLSLYFHRREGDRFSTTDDIWVSQRTSVDDAWGAPVNLGATVNSPFRDFTPTLSRDEHWLFLSSERPGGVGLADLWVSWRPNIHDDFGWQAPTNLGPNVNSESNDFQVGAHFENDAGPPQLFFASDRLGGPGLNDLYMSELQADGTWGPATLIPEVSSAAAEARPTLRHDGLEIYFHRGPPNDLWVATRNAVDEPWSTPVKLDPPINSNNAELHPYVSADSETLVFSSGRPGGFGNDDLYAATRSKSHGQE